jgi:flagellar hook assembly protein FlgD
VVRRGREKKEKLEEAKEIQKKYYDRNTKRVEFGIGDIVMLKEMANIPGKFNIRWEGPFSITERKGNVNYKIISQNGKKLLIVHSDRLKKFNSVEKNDNQTLEISVDKEPSLVKEPRYLITRLYREWTVFEILLTL